MSAYEKIKNPETGRYVSIYGKKGQQILTNYLETFQFGGMSKKSDGLWSLFAGIFNNLVGLFNPSEFTKTTENDADICISGSCKPGGCCCCNGANTVFKDKHPMFDGCIDCGIDCGKIRCETFLAKANKVKD